MKAHWIYFGTCLFFAVVAGVWPALVFLGTLLIADAFVMWWLRFRGH